MIPAGAGAAFTTAADGDLRGDPAARSRVSEALGIPDSWATVRQVHGSRVVETDGPGPQGDADAIVTTVPGLPLAVFTADCVGVVFVAAGAVGVAHAGWRGADAGIVERTAGLVETRGGPVVRAVVGPHIGPCCFEVGEEVAARFPDGAARTSWGTPSVDLAAVLEARLGRTLERLGGCTMCGEDAFSHRGGRDSKRMAAIGWLP